MQKVRRLPLCVVVFTVHHTGASRHALHLAGVDGLHIAHAVFVRETALQHIADNFHIPVRVGAKARAFGNAVLVNDAQIAPAHVQGVVVPRKRKAVKGLQPAVVAKTTLFGFAHLNHGDS